MSDTATADLVFTGGPVHTGSPARSRATTVAVRGERIVAVGHDEVRELIGPRTEVVDLAGRLLVPGFQDAHAHPVGGGLEMGQCDLSGATTRAEYRERITAYARTHADAEWITGGGWAMEAFPGGLPTAAELDALVSDRPVYLVNRDHHGAWVNSRALERAGLDARTPDPSDGRIERHPDGTPTGMLQEGAANLVGRLVPQVTREERVAGLLRAQELLHSLGITAWQDALLGEHANLTDPTDAYLACAEDGTLTARVVGALWWDRARGTEQIEELLARRAAGTRRRLRSTTVKIMQDGVAENGTAALLSPYLDGCGCVSDNSGISFVPPEDLKTYVTELDAHGFQVHFHALGDRAVREALDAVEAARRANGRTDTRPHLAHLQVVHPDDIGRFRELGATANLQPLWAAHEPQMDELTIPFLGAERASWQYPFGALLRSGATLAAGSDWPVSSPDPLQGIHVAVNRVAPDAPAGTPVFLPGERIGLHDALTAYTAGSAYANHLDHETGTVAEGFLADLVVLDRDPFAGPPEEIGATRVEQTFVGGQRVFG
ncbi:MULTISPECIES: amidohydrolase [Streptomyces]|uniref:amidohydrolase n=1 Tax=Streptomyces TaxID=1883 RepID=UPI00167B523D|nr:MULTISPECIES: amidohydrolase [Streptomyces]MBK3521167.1 amidohydrolase [Streptomyces sp. MBT70]GGR59370.1 amidohydrolase [Streptomyces eurythermus]